MKYNWSLWWSCKVYQVLSDVIKLRSIAIGSSSLCSIPLHPKLQANYLTQLRWTGKTIQHTWSIEQSTQLSHLDLNRMRNFHLHITFFLQVLRRGSQIPRALRDFSKPMNSMGFGKSLYKGDFAYMHRHILVFFLQIWVVLHKAPIERGFMNIYIQGLFSHTYAHFIFLQIWMVPCKAPVHRVLCEASIILLSIAWHVLY